MNNLDVVIMDDHVNVCMTALGLSIERQVHEIPLALFDTAAYYPQSETLILFCDGRINQAALCKTLTNSPHFHRYQTRICVFRQPPKTISKTLALQLDDFIFLPCSPSEFQLRLNLLENHKSTTTTSNSETQILLEEFSALNLRGQSESFIEALKIIKKTAKCDVSILIEGETGTGKENAARAIHQLSMRKTNAFIPVNCGAVPDSLLESELFGHEKGAFTDAKQRQTGLIALANQGTLFLDEVDSLSPKAQAALLRFLQTGEYRPLGSSSTQQSQARIIAATNANLIELVKQGLFREDLYFRINVLNIRMPPLRERPEDIVIIAQHLIGQYATKYSKYPDTIHPASLRWMQRQPWPGNVRQLENVLLREFLLSQDSQLVIERSKHDSQVPSELYCELPESLTSFQEAKEAAINKFEQEYINVILQATNGNVSKAAKLAGKERRAFGKLVKKYKIDKTKYQDSSITPAYNQPARDTTPFTQAV